MTVPDPLKPITPSDRVVRDVRMLIVALVGLALMGGGGYAEYVILQRPTVDHALVWTFLIVIVVGALLLPSLFDILWPRVRTILVFIFPNGIPLPGGRRIGDPPVLPPATQPSEQPPPAPFPPPGFGQPGNTGDKP